MIQTKHLWAGATIALAASTAFAAVSADEAKQLGTTLTAIGAEVAGNADKSIPAYTGGLTTPPASYKKGSGIRPDPYADEKPSLSIKAADLAKYDSKLTAGTKELLKRNPGTMRLDVYPTHRSMAFPKYVADNTLKNATSVKTTDSGLGLEGNYAGIPFPIPKTGNEAMWNHILRYSGPTQYTKFDSINVDSTGKAVLATTAEIYVDYPYYDPKRTGVAAANDVYFRTKLAYTAPARRAGEALLLQDYMNPMTNNRKAWQYLPGQRRVKLAPDIAYDTPNPGTAGASTYDETWVFNGAMDRYDWKLVGKREMYVPYNSYKLSDPKLKYADMLKPGHINQDLARYELHRVWVVDSTLKAGTSHIYARRTFYIDEDSWAILLIDKYDGRGDLWRTAEFHNENWYNVPMFFGTVEVHNDLQSGRYIAMGLRNEEKLIYEPIKRSPGDYTPNNLRGTGVR